MSAVWVQIIIIIIIIIIIAAVRYGRVPKRSRERSGEESASTTRVSTSDAEQSDAETKQLAVYDVILTVSQAFHANCGYTEEQTRGLVRKPLQAQPVCAFPRQ